jgi:hypothetical protein
MVEQKVPQPARDAFRGVGGQSSGGIGRGALKDGKSHKCSSNGEQGLPERIADPLALSQDVVREEAQQQIGDRLRDGRGSQRKSCSQVGQAVISHDPPQTLEAVLFQGGPEIECEERRF